MKPAKIMIVYSSHVVNVFAKKSNLVVNNLIATLKCKDKVVYVKTHTHFSSMVQELPL